MRAFVCDSRRTDAGFLFRNISAATPTEQQSGLVKIINLKLDVSRKNLRSRHGVNVPGLRQQLTGWPLQHPQPAG
jgi:hypothetical protein